MMRVGYTTDIEEEVIVKPRRHNKKPTIIGLGYEESKQYFHCRTHSGIRLLRTNKGYICTVGCGYTYPAYRLLETEIE